LNQNEQKRQQHHKLLQNQNEFPTINNIVKAVQTKDDDKAKILQAEQKLTESTKIRRATRVRGKAVKNQRKARIKQSEETR